MVGLLLYRDPVSDCRQDCIVVMCRLPWVACWGRYSTAVNMNTVHFWL